MSMQHHSFPILSLDPKQKSLAFPCISRPKWCGNMAENQCFQLGCLVDWKRSTGHPVLRMLTMRTIRWRCNGISDSRTFSCRRFPVCKPLRSLDFGSDWSMRIEFNPPKNGCHKLRSTKITVERLHFKHTKQLSNYKSCMWCVSYANLDWF